MSHTDNVEVDIDDIVTIKYEDNSEHRFLVIGKQSRHLIIKDYSDISKYILIEITEDECRAYNINRKFLHQTAIPFLYTNKDSFANISKPKRIGDKVKVISQVSDKGEILALRDNKNCNGAIQDLEIVGRCFLSKEMTWDYMLLLPSDSQTGFILDQTFHDYGVEKYYGHVGIPVTEEYFIMSEDKPKVISGLHCANKYCRTHCPYVSETNCPNNIFLCWSCRDNPMTYAMMVK